MARSTLLIIALLFMDALLGLPGAVAGSDQKADAIPAEDYALYDQVVTSKFFTSATQLVVIERMTRLRLSPLQEGPTPNGVFQEQGYFDDQLPADVIQEIISLNRQASRLEGRFHFAAGYRFAMEGRLEEPEVSLARPGTVAHAGTIQVPSVLDRLAFSHVARNLRNDQALLYVEALRPDGTGAGFLLRFRRQGQNWTLFDTEFAWTIRPQLEPEDEPLLAP